MVRFEFTMEIDGVERVKRVEIPKSELESKHIELLAPELREKYKSDYRANVINSHLERWALSKLKLSYKEVSHDQRD